MAADHTSSMQNLSISGVPAYSNNISTSPLTNGSYLMANLGSGRSHSAGGGSNTPVGQNGCDHNSNASNSPSVSPKSSPLHGSNDTLNSSASVSSGVGSQNSTSSLALSSSPGSNASLADYLGQLIKDRKQLEGFPHMFYHVERLLDEEINKVRVNLFQVNAGPKEPLVLPDIQGATVTLTEKVYVPVDDYPDFNFVGRILGPRGLTAKQLEKDTQCKIMIRGKGSTRDKQKEAQNKGKPNWEHLSDKLHVLITVEDCQDRARIKLARAVEEIKKLLVPMTEADDELKKRQLMELAIINGTYRDNGPKSNPILSAAALPPQYYNLQGLQMLARQQALGAPLMLPPRQHVSSGASSPYYHTSSTCPSPLSFTMSDAAVAGLFSPYDYAYNPALASSLLSGEYSLDQFPAVAGGVAKQKRHLGTTREHPYSRALAAAMAAVSGATTGGNPVPANASSSST